MIFRKGELYYVLSPLAIAEWIEMIINDREGSVLPVSASDSGVD